MQYNTIVNGSHLKLIKLSAGIFCKQFVPGSDRAESRVWARSKLFGIPTSSLRKKYIHIYSNKKVTSVFHGTVSINPVKMSQQK